MTTQPTEQEYEQLKSLSHKRVDDTIEKIEKVQQNGRETTDIELNGAREQ